MLNTTDHAHAREPSELAELLESRLDSGLAQSEVNQRLSFFGANELDSSTGPRAWRVFVAQFHNPLIYVLLGSASLTLVIGRGIDSAVIIGVVLVNALVGFVQEWRAGLALAALARMTSTHATVIRESISRRVAARDVVPGDIVTIVAGDRVPADLRLFSVKELQIDEATLTGESAPVHKHPECVPQETSVADRTDIAFSGTLVTSGRGVGLVVATGMSTQMGRIQELMVSAEGVETPLTRKLTRFSKWLTVIILGLAAITFILGLTRGEDPADMVTAAVALAVAAIPEGLPAAITITLAIGVSRMARRNAIVRRLPAVEALGSTTVICTDKTGTLTENRMTVQRVFTGQAVHNVGLSPTAFSEDVRDCLEAGVLCNDATVGSGVHIREDNLGDPTELALIAAASLDAEVFDRASNWERIQEIPFSSDLRYMATLHKHQKSDARRVVVKGAVEEVLAMCVAEAASPAAILACTDDFGSHALRVMAFAWTEVPREFSLTTVSLHSCLLEFLGLQAMIDPPRPEAIRAVRACHTAGIKVKMITGDHQRTAEAIAREIGLRSDGTGSLRVLSGVDLAGLPSEKVPQAISETDVFARVTAEQKLTIVRSLQADGGVVAMTGDGVNDAPALKQADIGVAMGLGGTEVAKETSEIVLTDDDFATIEAAIEEGRGVFDNLTKFIAWTLPTNLGEGLIILAAIMVGTSLPILPVQILWINMTTAVALGLMLAFEPKEADIMQRPPRPPNNQIVTRELLLRIVLVGGLMLLGSFGLFTVAVDAGASSAEARTLAVNAFIAMEIGYLFNCRSLQRSVWSVGWFSNPWIWAGIGSMLVLQAAFTYLPIMNNIFGSAPLPASAWWPVVTLGVVIYVVIGAVKWLENLRDANGPAFQPWP
jgi:calcium-translocating P-type ATPase